MRVKEISVSRSVRVNTGNYEGTEHFVAMKVELDEFDDEREAHLELNAVVERAMLAQLVRAYKVRGKSMTQDAVAKHHGLTYLVKE